MTSARLGPMAADDLEAWRAARSTAGTPLPDPTGGEPEALTLLVDEMVVGGVLVAVVDDTGGPRCEVRVLQTTLPHHATEAWSAVIDALEGHARLRGAVTLTTAIAPALAAVFGAAGFRATMTTLGKRLDRRPTELQDDRRVAVRPMDAAERARFVTDVGAQLRSGMERAGVVDRDATGLEALDSRLARLAQDPPPVEELLVTATVDGVPVGRAWGTLVEHDGALAFHGNTLDLFPEHRGRRLTPSFLGALRRLLDEAGVDDLRLRVYAHDEGARRAFLGEGAEIRDVHVRKDLGPGHEHTPHRGGGGPPSSP